MTEFPSSNHSDGLVYVSKPGGHRGPYVSLFADKLQFSGLIAPPSFRVMRQLIATPRLLLATFEESLPMFSIVLAARAVLGRPTAGIFLSPQRCFIKSELKCRLKKLAFMIYKRVPGLTLFTITPFSLEPRFAEVANVGAYDPQYWDMHDGESITLPKPTAFSDEILKQASGRSIICLPGSLNAEKGFPFLAEILQANPSLSDSVLVVAAGKVQANASDAARIFVANGGVLFNRRIEDDELESLYRIANAVWCCYEPRYDQASGIFGRAMQFGIPVIVRKSSLIERFAASTPLPVISVAYGDKQQAASLLASTIPPRLAGESFARHADAIASWRDHFIQALETALQCDRKCSGKA